MLRFKIYMLLARDTEHVPPQLFLAGAGASIATKAMHVIDALATAPGCEGLKKHLADHCDILLELIETNSEKIVPSLPFFSLSRALSLSSLSPLTSSCSHHILYIPPPSNSCSHQVERAPKGLLHTGGTGRGGSAVASRHATGACVRVCVCIYLCEHICGRLSTPTDLLSLMCFLHRLLPSCLLPSPLLHSLLLLLLLPLPLLLLKLWHLPLSQPPPRFSISLETAQ